MNFNNVQLKITDKGISFEGGSKKKKKASKMVTPNSKTQPINSFGKEMLQRGGWSQEDIARMMKFKSKSRVYGDGGYVYI